jgi:hypothetical protein
VSKREYKIEIEGAPDYILDVELRTAIAVTISKKMKEWGVEGGFSIGTSGGIVGTLGADTSSHITADPQRPRLAACVVSWPECQDGEYNPACCRFPKACSCQTYNDSTISLDRLERKHQANG